MPYVDAGLFEPRTVLGVDHLKGERKRRAMLPFGNVGAHKLRVEVERTFGRLGVCTQTSAPGSAAAMRCCELETVLLPAARPRPNAAAAPLSAWRRVKPFAIRFQLSRITSVATTLGQRH